MSEKSTETSLVECRTIGDNGVTVARTQNDTVLLLAEQVEAEQTQSTTTVVLTKTQAVKVQKLLSMPGRPIPEFRGSREFFLAENIPQSPRDSVLPMIAAADETDGVVITGQDHLGVTLSQDGARSLERVLSEWGYTLGGDGVEYSVLTMPAMIVLEDGISEPLLHAEYDEVLEHYHQAVGYWSPSTEAYVTQH